MNEATFLFGMVTKVSSTQDLISFLDNLPAKYKPENSANLVANVTNLLAKPISYIGQYRWNDCTVLLFFPSQKLPSKGTIWGYAHNIEIPEYSEFSSIYVQKHNNDFLLYPFGFLF